MMMKKMMMMVNTMTDIMIMRFVVVGHNLQQDHNSSANLSRYHNNSDDIVNDNCNSHFASKHDSIARLLGSDWQSIKLI